MGRFSHTVTVTIKSNYRHGSNQGSSLTLEGDGGIEFFFDVFKLTLLAAGFALDTAKKLDELDI